MKSFRAASVGVLLALSVACAGSTESGAGVAARVGDDVITTSELEGAVARGLANEAFAAQVGTARRGEYQRQVLGRMLNGLLVREAARRLDLSVTDADVDARLAEFEEQAKARGQTLAAQAAEGGIAAADIRDVVRDFALTDVVADELVGDKPITAELASRLDNVTAAHILVKEKALADSILAQLSRGGDFAALARAHSIDESNKNNGGQLEPAGRGTYVPEFERVVFSAPIGRVVGPVRTQFGYHVIKVIKRTTVKPSQVTADQRRQLLQDERDEAFREYIKKLADKLGVSVNPRFGKWNEETVQIDPPKDELSSPSGEPTGPAPTSPGAPTPAPS